MQVTAHLRSLRMAPRKVRLAAGLVVGMNVDEALAQLTHLQKGAVVPIRKLLHSAIANAEHNAKLDPANLFVRQIFVNQGATLKRFQPRAFGRATPIRKRTSHVTLVLDERVPTAAARQQPYARHDSSVGVPGRGTVPPPVVMTERPRAEGRLPHAHGAAPGTVGVPDARTEEKEPFDVRRQGKHRHKEHEDARSGKRTGGFFKRLFTRRSGER